jgi:hypothetical protein
MRVPLSLSLSLLFLAVSSCFSSGSETDRYPRRRNARTKKHNRRKHTVSRNKKNFVLAHPFYYYHRRYYYYYYYYYYRGTVFHVDKISSLLAYLTVFFFDFFVVKTPSKKKISFDARVRVSHNTRAHSRASAPTAKTNYPNNRSSEQEEDLSVCVCFSHARVCIYNSTF